MYPLPIIEDLLQESPGNVFSTVDLQKAFYQIPVAEEDIEKTAVTTPFGLFEFLGTSLGLRNSAQSMQRTMNHILRNLPFAKACIDDIFVVASSSHEEHLAHLRQLFTTLREANLKLNEQKCTFGRREVLYLGFQVTPDGFSPPDAKIQAIEKYAKPTDATELRRFLGMLNYYRQCMPSAAKIQAPLHELLKGLKNKRSKLKWTSAANEAFDKCKESIVKAACTTFLRPNAPLALRTDASDEAIGAALEQQDADGIWQPLGFFRKSWTPLSVDTARTTENFWQSPLIYAAKQRSDKASPRQVRSFEYISRFNTDLKHSRGSDNVVADALSRVSPTTDSNDSSSKPEEPAHSGDNETPSPPGEAQELPEVATITMPSRLSPAIIAAAQEEDEELTDAQAQPSFNLQQIVLDGYEICATSHTDPSGPTFQRGFAERPTRSNTYLRTQASRLRPVPSLRVSCGQVCGRKSPPGPDAATLANCQKIRKPLEPPYSGPHRIVKRIDQRTYEIEINGEAQVVSTDQLKPAHMQQDDCAAPPAPPQLSERQPASEISIEHRDQPSDSPEARTRHVSFASQPSLLTGGGVDVAPQSTARVTRASARRAASAAARGGNC
ncbi:unnamed protein product [Trichogramma brassicae]|uniref:RNA-directed DNA polymerase n=1 Tax=Trichogramma brassicae TaxID=86971 RepID=A0A6H5IE05_9HYME|nr:unnamed protein product [Trichogramma brassicae]